jgi:hypothetical protein
MLVAYLVESLVVKLVEKLDNQWADLLVVSMAKVKVELLAEWMVVQMASHLAGLVEVLMVWMLVV